MRKSRSFQHLFVSLILLSGSLVLAQPAQKPQQPPSKPPSSPHQLPPSSFRPDDPFEVSALVTGLEGNGLGNNLGIGGRFTYTYSEYEDSEISTVSAVEGEIDWLAVDKAPDVFHGGRALLALAGITESVGDTSGRIGVKLGTGFVRSGNAVTRLNQAAAGTFTPAKFGSMTDPVVNFGLLFQYSAGNRPWGFRFDIGDLVVFYPDLPARGFRARHQLAASLALTWRFPSKQRK